jgi:hypothetical protein
MGRGKRVKRPQVQAQLRKRFHGYDVASEDSSRVLLAEPNGFVFDFVL